MAYSLDLRLKVLAACDRRGSEASAARASTSFMMRPEKRARAVSDGKPIAINRPLALREYAYACGDDCTFSSRENFVRALSLHVNSLFTIKVHHGLFPENTFWRFIADVGSAAGITILRCHMCCLF